VDDLSNSLIYGHSISFPYILKVIIKASVGLILKIAKI
jgi:hypothetical protein